MTVQRSLEDAWVDDWGHAMTAADRTCRRESGRALSPSWKSLMFTMWLKEQRGEAVDWRAVASQCW